MSHLVHDRRSLVMHRCIARRLRGDPSLRQVALENLLRWSGQPHVSEHVRTATAEWLPLLNGRMGDLLRVLTSEDEESIRLRQSSPFAGPSFLSEARRLKILRRVRR